MRAVDGQDQILLLLSEGLSIPFVGATPLVRVDWICSTDGYALPHHRNLTLQL